MDFEDWLFEQNEWYEHHHARDFNDEQIEWMQLIYEEFADENGDIDWSKHEESAWWYYMVEVLDIPEDTVERYVES